MQQASSLFFCTWRSKGKSSHLNWESSSADNCPRTFCDTTMYIYVSEIFPTEIRPIGMGFSLFGQFTSTIILLQTAPIGFVNIGWKYYLVIIIWCIFFIPIVYLYFPETAKLSLEEISARFGDDVAVHVNDVPAEQRKELDEYIGKLDITHMEESTDKSKAMM